jgi:hypothetical protein
VAALRLAECRAEAHRDLIVALLRPGIERLRLPGEFVGDGLEVVHGRRSVRACVGAELNIAHYRRTDRAREHQSVWLTSAIVARV